MLRGPCFFLPRLAVGLGLMLGALPARSVGAEGALEGVISRTVAGSYPSLHRCWRKVLAVDRQRQGTVFLQITLGPGEGVAAASVVHDELGDALLARCLEQRVRGWRLAGVQAAGAAAGEQILLPLTFAADPGQQAVHRDDAAAVARGTAGTLYPLLTEKNVGARRASLSLLTLARGRLALPAAPGAAAQALYVLSGQGALQDQATARSWRLQPDLAVELPPAGSYSLSGTLELLWLVVSAQPAGASSPAAERAPRRRPRLVRLGKIKPQRPAAGVTRWPLLRPGQRYSLGRIEARRESTLSPRPQAKAAELVYVLQGQGELQLKERLIALRPGLALYLPAGWRQQLRVAKTLKAVQVFVPAGPKTHRPSSASETPHEPD